LIGSSTRFCLALSAMSNVLSARRMTVAVLLTIAFSASAA
jgi:hypothetical protein